MDHFVQLPHLLVYISLYFFKGSIDFFFKDFYLFACVSYISLRGVLYILLKSLYHLHEMRYWIIILVFMHVRVSWSSGVGELGSDGAKLHWILLLMILYLSLAI